MAYFESVCVLGLGYIGLPTAVVVAAAGTRVVGVDIDPAVVWGVNNGRIHIVEPDLEEAVANEVIAGRLSASLEPQPADVFIIAVPTPTRGGRHEPDLSYIEAACRSISPHLRQGNLVILESTSPVGTTAQVAEWLSHARPDLRFPTACCSEDRQVDVSLAYCPERVLPGSILRELRENDRVVGGYDDHSRRQASAFYHSFVGGEVLTTTAETAEMAKLTENSFRDVNIAFANELSLICHELGIDVWELIRIANRHPRVDILRPGPGVGGHCIAVDPWFIVNRTPDLARIIRTAREVNDAKPGWVIQQVAAALARISEERDRCNAADLTIACYGLAFKPDIDDLRGSPALAIARSLALKHAGRLLLVEPNIETLPDGFSEAALVSFEDAIDQADVHVLLVSHSAFRERPPALHADAVIVDTQGLWTKPVHLSTGLQKKATTDV